MNFFRLDPFARNAAVIHFLLMIGYKLFSFYFPLFLSEHGFSAPKVAYAYVALYLPLALIAPFIGALNRFVRPEVLTIAGIAGYAVYGFGMLSIADNLWFYVLQIMLGVSAALFFVSIKGVLMGADLKSTNSTFGWFYAAPFYADAIAPALGALIIWQSGFVGVFVASAGIHALNAVFSAIALRRVRARGPILPPSSVSKEVSLYAKVTKSMFLGKMAWVAWLSLVVVIAGGMYRAFFLLFLRDIGWSQDKILLYGTVFSVCFTACSLFVMKWMTSHRSEEGVRMGGLLLGASTMVFGGLAPVLSFGGVLVTMLVHGFGGLIQGSGRSAVFAENFREDSKEIAAVDTMFSPLGTAIGSFAGGLLIVALGYPLLFSLTGAVITFTSLGFIVAKHRHSDTMKPNDFHG